MARSFWRGVITGGIIGGLIGAFMAPAIRPDVRDRIMARGRDLRKKAERIVRRARSEMDEAVEQE